MTIRFGNSIAKKPMKCNDCEETINVGDWFAWDNWRKRLEGRAIALCSIECKQLFQIDEEPKKVHRIKATDVTELRKQVEAYERDRSNLQEDISNLQQAVSTINANINALKTPSSQLSEADKKQLNLNAWVILTTLKQCFEAVEPLDGQANAMSWLIQQLEKRGNLEIVDITNACKKLNK